MSWSRISRSGAPLGVNDSVERNRARHDSQINRLEQVMTALAEAQVKTEQAQEKLTLAMAALAKSHAETEATTRALSRPW
jgi:hypothetical protein